MTTTKQTETGIDILCQQAADLLADGTIADYKRVADDCGELTLLRVDFADATYAVVGAEYSDDGETVAGYTWTHYWPCEEGQYADPGKTDGDSDIARFARDMTTLAQTL